LSSCLPIIFLKQILLKALQPDNPKEVPLFHMLKALDATAAPGNKTLQLSEIFGEVLSFEKDEQRFGILKKRVHDSRASRNVQVSHTDFLDC
jgi:hypothetical protein